MADQIKLINSIGLKMESLYNKLVEAKEERDVLLKSVDRLEAELKIANDNILQLEEKNKMLGIARSTQGKPDTSEMKAKISELVREVDQCIALLNR